MAEYKIPKKVKYRKQQRGRMSGKATRGATVAFGEYGLKAMEAAWITGKQIEAAREASRPDSSRGLNPKVSASARPFRPNMANATGSAAKTDG